jgi:flagellar biosynthesis protein FlhF
MQVVQFIAADAASALAQIHKQLGPDAVVLSVRPLRSQGVSRILRHSNRIEVLACRPENPGTTGLNLPLKLLEASDFSSASGKRWRSIAWLETMGLLPAHAERLQNAVDTLSSESLPASLETEWPIVTTALNNFWRTPPAWPDAFTQRPHVLIGPPGSGKTTALCKWLTLAVLTDERRARVWRLDGSTGNTSEHLTVHCEMLGVPVERFWSPPPNSGELLFIDLPGVEAHDGESLTALRRQLSTLPNPCVHLVLNAAYETEMLLAQWRAFAPLEPADLILTHLDEELRRIKLWNLVFGTNCTIRFLSAGQKIPGEFQNASAEMLFPSETPQ